MATHFQKEIQLRFREADPAGIMFFGNIFGWAHDCFEDFIEATGFTWKRWFQTQDYIVPIRHTECNYLRPFRPGETYTITASVARIGESSFQMKYVFSQHNHLHAEVRMTHAFVDAHSKGKISVPESVRECLKVYLNADS